METDKENKISHYLEVLKKAKTDNEKFAALLMVAKVTKDENCGQDVKKEILEAIGRKFFTRLLKTKSVPEDCPPNIYKSVAMSILSALCGQPEMALNPVLKENMTSFNGIILQNPSDEDISDCQLVDDTYECFSSLCRSSEGIEIILEGRSVSTLCQVVISQSYGCKKAQDVLFCVLSSVGVQTWVGCEMAFNSVFSYFSQQFKTEQGEKKFELCKTLVFLLTSVPREVEYMEKKPWIENVVSGLDSILRSKLGTGQREPALRLASLLIQICGVESMTPPVTPDCKLLLLTTHLCCVEVRMVLEADDHKQAFSKGPLLSSCYSYLECIINHLTSGPTLNLDERQVLQLHSAMMGAFGAVIHFLKRVSEDSTVQWNSIILATIRILAAWMAEETTALKEEVCELIPFLIQVSKLCLSTNNDTNREENCDRTEIEGALTEGDTVIDKSDNNSKTVGDKSVDNEDNKTDTDINKIDKRDNNSETVRDKSVDNEENKTEKDTETVDNNNDDVKESVTKAMSDVTISNTDTNVNVESENKSLLEDKSDESGTSKDSGQKKQVTFEQTNGEVTETSENCNGDKELGTETNETGNKTKESKYQREYEQVYDGDLLRDIGADHSTELMEQELLDLHLRVNIFHFLLPGMCHMTADDVPRQILLNCGALSLLDLYMWRQWEKFLKTPDDRKVQSSLVILCNIFLNMTIVQPDAITEYEEFSHILLLTVKGITVAELNYIVIWSHLVTLGLMLIRLLHKKLDEFLESESISVFFQSCVKYMNSAYIVKYKRKGQAVMDLAEQYTPVWDQISQTWFLSMQAFCALVPLCKEATSVVLQTGWLPTILKHLLEVRGNGVAEEVRSCYLLLLISMAKESESAKLIIKEKKGIEISKMYKSQELREILQKPSQGK